MVSGVVTIGILGRPNSIGLLAYSPPATVKHLVVIDERKCLIPWSALKHSLEHFVE